MPKVSAKKIQELYERCTSKDGMILLTGWARAGLTMEQIAKKCGVSINTLYKWIRQNPDIAAAIDKGKEVVDYEVENALYKSAIGYEVIEQALDDKGNKKLVKKYIPPNITAQIFWLKNRMPHLWRDQRQTEITGGLPVVIKDDIKE